MKNRNPGKLSRRGFGTALGLLASGATSSAQTNGTELNAADSAEVEARMAEVIRKYGDRLSPEQRDSIHRTLVRNERMLETVRNFSLSNGDPMATTLKLQPGEMDFGKAVK